MLDETEDSFRTIMDSALDAIFLIDERLRIAYWNPSAEKMFGYPARRALADPFLVSYRLDLSTKYFPDLQEVMSSRSKAFAARVFESTGVRRNGGKFPVEVSCSKVRVRGSVYVVLIVRDITERKMLQNHLTEYSKQLEEAVNAKTVALEKAKEQLLKSQRLAAIGELAGMIGHDLRNPLTGMKGAAYYLKAKCSSDVGEKGRAMLETIENCINHSDKIVKDLLEYSREFKLELQKISLPMLIEATSSVIEIPKGVKVIYSANEDLTFTADMEKMTRVFVNLFKNAFDAMPQGGVLTIKSEERKGNTVLHVSDTGCGMSAETLKQIWSPLFTTKAKGMGFGLPICKRIVEAHHGKISIDSEPDKGTTVTLEIPGEPPLSTAVLEVSLDKTMESQKAQLNI